MNIRRKRLEMNKPIVVFLLLAGILLVGLLAGELSGGSRRVDPQPVTLATLPATATRTPGWWSSVATWTPTATGEVAPTGEATRAVEATATPVLDIPPVRTVEMPTPQPTWTRRP